MRLRFLYSVLAAALVTGAVFAASVSLQAQAPAALDAPSRTPNGKPDLSGVWGGGGQGGAGGGFTDLEEGSTLTRLFPSRRCAPNQKNCRDNTNQANDYEFTFRTDPNRPIYKPEHWDKVQKLD